MNRSLTASPLSPSVVLCACGLLAGCGGERPEPKPKPKTVTERFEKIEVDETKPTAPTVASTDTKKPAADDPVPLALRDLTSNDADERADAVNALAAAEYEDERREEIAAGLIQRLADAQKTIREAAAIALRSKWARADDVPKIAGLLARERNEIRHAAMDVLGALKTEESAKAVAPRLTSAFDRGVARSALIAIGSVAEPSVLEYVEDQEPDVRLAVVQILDRIGTSESIDELEDLQMDPDPRVATAAAKALMK